MYSLRVLGVVRLDGPSGPVSGHLSQRRPLALLAVLAVAGDDGCTRDQLAGLLWGETDDQHALHELADTLYVVRRGLGTDAVLGDATTLRLNAAVVDSDIRAFRAALEHRDPAAAAAAYGGPLLEGFHPRGAAAFEEWLSGERRRLAARYADALERLAKEAGADGDHIAAEAWWQRLAAHDPYNSRVAVSLAFALAAVSDRGNGLQHLRAHVRLLREEMGMEPDAELLAAEQILLAPRVSQHTGPTPQEMPATKLSEPLPRISGMPAAVPAGIEAALNQESAPPLAARKTPWWRRRAVRLAAAAIVLAVAAVAGGRWLRPGASASLHPRTAIAVLPFENLSAAGPQAYFAPGLHDELLTQLTKVAALSVRSRTSVMGYAGTAKPMKQIADELAVGSVVEGSVQVVGNRLRVSIQLIDAATDRHLWAEQYDRTLDDAFAVQSEITQRIVEAVGGKLTRAEAGAIAAAPTANAEAYRFYLQGRDYFLRPGALRQNLESAQQLDEQALALDPGYALAHAALSAVHGAMYWYGFDPSSARAAHQREEAEAALRLAPNAAQAHFAMGLAHYWGHRDYRRALDEFAIALRVMPNDARLWAFVGYVQRRLGNWDEALAALEKAEQLDPRDAGLIGDLGGGTYSLLHRYAEAVREFNRALGLAPDLHGAAIAKGWAYVAWQGQLDTLRAALSRMPRDAELAYYGTRTYQQLGLLLLERQPDSLLQALRAARVLGEVSPCSLFAAYAHQMRGDRPAARAAFDSALVLLDSVVRKRPDDWGVHAARGRALAGLGRRAEALLEARWLQQSAVYREDAVSGPSVAETRAQILAQVGEADPALDEIERLLAIPSGLSRHALRLDPGWDPIRDQPRFKALLRRYALR